MKIGILTLPLHINYGGILQCYALQTVLESMGHDVVVLNRRENVEKGLFLLRCGSLIKCIIRRYVLRKKYIVILSPWAENYVIDKRAKNARANRSELNSWIRRYINQTHPLRSSEALKNYVERNHLDCIVVGSDQVWRGDYSVCITDFFLGFLPITYKIKKIAYAVSFGMSELNISADELLKCIELSKQFDAVSVREKSGVGLMKEKFGIEAKQVLDPTLLLSKEQYMSVLHNAKNAGGGLFCYVLDSSTEKSQIIKVISKKLALKSDVVTLQPRDENGYIGRHKSVEKWLNKFAEADFVVTDSFHGCVFSIIFEKPFIAIANKSRGLDRFYSLLDSLGLKNRLVFSYEELMEKLDILALPVNYDVVNAEKDILKEKSLGYLKTSISCCECSKG